MKRKIVKRLNVRNEKGADGTEKREREREREKKNLRKKNAASQKVEKV